MASRKSLFNRFSGKLGNVVLYTRYGKEFVRVCPARVKNPRTELHCLLYTSYNEKLSWEETDQYDFGLDLDFFDYRLGVVLDYYYRYTDNLLMRVPLPKPNSYDRQWRNAAAISNEGVELLIKYDIFRRPNLFWKVSVNWSKNWNRFEKSYDKHDTNKWIIGKPLNGIYAMKTDGFVNTQDEIPIIYNSEGWSHYMGDSGFGYTYYKPGDLKYMDVNGDGSANFDRCV